MNVPRRLRKRWEANGQPPWFTWPLLWPLLDVSTFRAFLIVLLAIPIAVWVSVVWGVVLLVLGLAVIAIWLTRDPDDP